MNPSSAPNHCPTCGTAIPENAPSGLCPKCLLVGGGTVPPEEEAADPEAKWEDIGPYRLLGPIGEGGMGNVYVAEQGKPIHRKVALKLIKPGMDSREVLTRFEAERQALALMDHPGIARVYDAGTTEDGRPYFVMELVKGRPLTEFCDEQRLSLRERLRLFQEICQAVQHAHQKGVIHRDLKPSNILVALDDEGRPVPKIIDFGVAKALGPGLTERTLFTDAGHLIGTPQYMSPEQAGFDATDIDTRADIYSLGILLYELLTGRTPLERGALRKAGVEGMLRAIREQEPPKPSTRINSLEENTRTNISEARSLPASKLAKRLRGDLDWVVMKALEKERGRRYDTANALAQDIRCFLENEEVAASPPSAAYRLGKLVRRNKGTAVAAGLVAISLIAGLLVSLWQTKRANHARAETADANRSLRLESYFEKVSLASLSWQSGDLPQARAILDSCDPEHRHLEWGLLKQACQSDPVALDGIRNARRIRYSAKGSYLAVMHEQNVSLVRGYDGGNARILQFGTELKDIAIDAGEHRLAALSTDGSIHVRGLDEEGISTEIVHPDGRPFRALAMGGRGKWLAAGDADGFVFLFDSASGELTKRFSAARGQQAAIRHVALSRNGMRLASGSQSGRIRIWDVASGRAILNQARESAWRPACHGLLFTSDDRFLVNIVDFGVVTVRDAMTGLPVHNYDVHLADRSIDFGIRPVGAAWNGGGGQVREGNDLLLAIPRRVNREGQPADGLVTIFELATGRFHQNLSVPGVPIRSASFEPGGRSVAAVSEDGRVHVWPLRSRDLNSGHFDETWASFCTAISPDDRLVAIGSYGSLKVYDARSGTRILDLGEPKTRGERRELFGDHNIRRLSFSPDGKFLAAGQQHSGKLTILDMSRLKVLRHVQAHSGGDLHTVEYSPSGRHLVTANSRGEASAVHLWDCVDWRLVDAIPVSKLKDRFDSATFSPDGGSLAVADPGQGLLLFDLAGREPGPARVLAPDLGGPIRFSPDGESIAACRGKDIVLVDVSSARIEHRFSGHDSKHVSGIRYSGDGRRMVSVAYDGSMRIWDVEHLRPALAIPSDVRDFYGLALSSDNRWIITGEQGKWKVDGSVTFTTRRWESRWPEHGDPPAATEDDPPYDWSRLSPGVSFSLLEMAAEKGDLIDGSVDREDGGLRIQSRLEAARLSAPIIPRGSYDLVGSFSAPVSLAGNSVGLILPAGGHFTTLRLPVDDGSKASITRSDGKAMSAEVSPNPEGAPIRPNRRYSVHARVDLDQNGEVAITVRLDDETVIEWAGHVRNLDLDRNFGSGVHLSQCISLVAPEDGEVIWHQLDLTMVNGDAWIIRP